MRADVDSHAVAAFLVASFEGMATTAKSSRCRELAGSVASISSDAYQLRCDLPLDGSQRSLGSCSVSPLR